MSEKQPGPRDGAHSQILVNEQLNKASEPAACFHSTGSEALANKSDISERVAGFAR